LESVLRAFKRFATGKRRALTVILAVLLLPLFGYAAGEWYKTRDYCKRFLEMHHGLAAADIVFQEEVDGHRVYSIRLDNGHDTEVSGYLKVPAAGSVRCPALLILGGVRTGRRTIEYIHGTRGVVLLALDYPYSGKREELGWWEFLLALGGIRRAIVRTVPAAMLGVDYLLTRDDVDANRIVAVGGSVGAAFVPALAATDRRIAGAAMLFGGADLGAVMRANLHIPGVLARPASWLGGVLSSPVEPAKYVGRISPRPVFMLNGTGDSRIPQRCSTRLYEAAAQPKTMRWIDAGHVNIRAGEFHRLVARQLSEWLLANGLVEPGALPEG
jgi:predicted esterase